MIINGNSLDELKKIKSNSVDCCVTSPPYWGLRDYGHDGQIGLEVSPQQYVDKLVDVFREVKRVLKDDGTLWLNLGDSYSGSGKGPAGNLGKKNNERHLEHKHSAVIPKGLKPKDLVGIPWRVAFALQEDGWYLRQDIIWAKPNPMPESVKDRCTKSHEYIFLLSKNKTYYFDSDAISEPVKEISKKRAKGGWRPTKLNISKDGVHNEEFDVMGTRWVKDKRNKRSVWTVTTQSFKDAHFATYPPELIRPCILAGSRVGGIVLDPFFGSGTTGQVALEESREFIGIEINPEYIKIAEKRLYGLQMKVI